MRLLKISCNCPRGWSRHQKPASLARCGAISANPCDGGPPITQRPVRILCTFWPARRAQLRCPAIGSANKSRGVNREPTVRPQRRRGPGRKMAGPTAPRCPPAPPLLLHPLVSGTTRCTDAGYVCVDRTHITLTGDRCGWAHRCSLMLLALCLS